MSAGHDTTGPSRVVIAGGIRGDSRIPQAGTAGKGRPDVVLVNPTDYFLYLPLLPEVEAGS